MSFSRNLTSIVAGTTTGLPYFVPGPNRHCFTASIAFSSKPEPRPLNFNIVRSAVGIDLDVQDDSSLDAGPLRFRCVLWCASGNYRRSLGSEVGLRIGRQTGQKEAKSDLPHEQIVHPTAGAGRKTGTMTGFHSRRASVSGSIHFTTGMGAYEIQVLAVASMTHWPFILRNSTSSPCPQRPHMWSM